MAARKGLVDVDAIAQPFREEIKVRLANSTCSKPRLVAFLCSKDPSAIQYATFTQRACVRDGIQFELKELPRTDLEDALIEANNVHGVAQLVCTNRMQDPSIHGILVYYPVFGLMDTYLQDVVCIEKDVEGMNTKYGSTFEIGRLFKGLTHVNRCRFNLYHNIRYFDEAKTKKCILPCTAIAIVKIIDTVGEYNKKFLEGEHLQNKVITVINRSEIVGRPLASMLANDGAIVYSIDITGCIIFQKGKVPGTIKMIESDISTEDAVRKSNIVVTGVPSPSYKIPLDWIQEGAVVINFSFCKNVDDAVAEKALYVPSIGKVTVAMLERNLVRLYPLSVCGKCGRFIGLQKKLP